MTMNLRRYSRTGLALALGAIALTQLGRLFSQPRFSQLQLSQLLVPAAHAQALTDDDVANYARAASTIEASRLEAYEKASDILASANSELDILDLPLNCTAARLSDMPDIPRADRVDLLTVLVGFCNEASQLAETNDLTPKRFNTITAAHQEDADLAERIKSEISSLEDS